MLSPFEEIRKRLLEIEREESVKIFYACESGSRAWGFPSKNSDYDVRFLYVREPEWYLSIDVEDKSDVIERPILDEYDVNGWDLRKALKLLRKSNPPLLEWLNSPTIYIEDDDISSRFKELAPLCYSATACTYHYLQMAKGNFREYLKGDTVSVKKYFYVLRPLLAIKWMEQSSDVVPMEFGVLVNDILEPGKLRTEIETLIERKKLGDELKRELRIDEISEFIESEMSRLNSKIIENRAEKPSITMLNSVFREILAQSKDR
ncbi:MAG: nucleotidyltransferase domain-containing protein [Pyrinomonadaceae bacterium]